jgi:hypothetical protein
MIKKQQKWIALFVTLTFVWLLQVSTMPLTAAGKTETVSSASTEQRPDYVEAVGQKAAPTPKKNILPVVLIGVGVVALAAVLFLVVLKTKYDITGSWQYYFKWDLSGAVQHGPYPLTFSGSQSSGQLSFLDPAIAMTGTYTADNKNVSFTISSSGKPWSHTGSFENKDKMSGTFTYPSGTGNGTWYATRTQ